MTIKDYSNIKIGILGGGQLGRMVIQSAIDLNLDIHILDPDENAPCRYLTPNFTQGSLTDFDTVYNFGKALDVITIEIENVNADALKQLQQEGKEVYPEPDVVKLIQDKRIQKQFYFDNNIPTSPFVLTENKADVQQYTNRLPGVHKLGKAGYDGRGTQVIKTADDLDKAFDKPGLLEDWVPFEKEIAVIVARNKSGEISAFPPVELAFHPTANLVEYLFSPATLSDAQSQKATAIAQDVITKLDMTGILAVEMFLTPEGEILVNECAPRPHNSGHHTIEGNYTSQFEQHLRAILDLPLGATDIKVPAAMVNLLGEDGHTGNALVKGIEDVMRMQGVHIHLYGKKTTKPFRKMGHVTITAPTPDSLREKANFVKDTLKIVA